MAAFLSLFLAARRPTPPLIVLLGVNRHVPPLWDATRPPPASHGSACSTAGLRRVSTSSIIYYEVDGDTSKYSLQSSTLYGRDQEWVLLAPAP